VIIPRLPAYPKSIRLNRKYEEVYKEVNALQKASGRISAALPKKLDGARRERQMEGFDYAKCIEISKRVRWDIDKDVIRGRQFDLSQKFLPDGLSKGDQLDFLKEKDRRFLSQVQGRTYANMFGFVERFIVAKVLELTRGHWLGDQIYSLA
jgi:hypothetical protein